MLAPFEDAQGDPTQLLGTSDNDDFFFDSSNGGDALNAFYGLTGDDTADATGFIGPWVFFDGSKGHDTLLVGGRPEEYAAEQKIGLESHKLMLTKSDADGILQRIEAINVERITFSDGTTWERADDSAELFPLA